MSLNITIKNLINENNTDKLSTILVNEINFNIELYVEISKYFIELKKENELIILLNNVNKVLNKVELKFLLIQVYENDLEKNIDKSIDLYEELINKNKIIDSLLYYKLAFLYSKKLHKEKYKKYLLLAFESNKNKNLKLQYYIISTLLFNFNYEKKKDFYKLYFEELKKYNELNVSFQDKYSIWNNKNNKNNNKIKLGFVSGDIKDHPVSYFLLSILKNYNINKYEIYIYKKNEDEDIYTKEIEKYCKSIKYIDLKNSKNDAEIIYKDNIDILFDLSGHTANNALLLFKYKVAPIQVYWLGYFASTGIPEMDYFITSELCIKKNEHQYFTEKVLNLPSSHLCYDFSLLEKLNLNQKSTDNKKEKDDFFNIGIFQNLIKISDDDIKVWKDIIKQIPNVKIVIKSQDFENIKVKENFTNKLKKNKVDINKIKMIGKTTFENHLLEHNDIDIMLDLLNVSGCTTSCQSMYMGVPVLTIEGTSMTTRYTEQFNKILELDNFIVKNKEDMVLKIKFFNENKDQLDFIKLNLKNKLLKSSIGDSKKFTKEFESLIESILK